MLLHNGRVNSMFDINIDKDAVEKRITQAVLDSSIGDHINKAVSECFVSQYGRDSVLDRAIKDEVDRQVSLSIRAIIEDRSEELKTAISEKLTDETLIQVATKALEWMIRKCDD